MDQKQTNKKIKPEHLHQWSDFLVGRRVQLINCTDEFTLLKYGDLGTIRFIDDTGTVFVDWDNGSKLGLIPGLDQWKVLHD